MVITPGVCEIVEAPLASKMAEPLVLELLREPLLELDVPVPVPLLPDVLEPLGSLIAPPLLLWLELLPPVPDPLPELPPEPLSVCANNAAFNIVKQVIMIAYFFIMFVFILISSITLNAIFWTLVHVADSENGNTF